MYSRGNNGQSDTYSVLSIKVVAKFNRLKIGASTDTDTPNLKTQLFPYVSLYYFHYPLFNRG